MARPRAPRWQRRPWRLAAPALLALALAATAPAAVSAQSQADTAPDPGAVRRGEYVYRAAGGCGCHTDTANGGPTLAGGRAMRTPFGTFFSTNLTPDPQTGLGRWSEADFLRAMQEGVAPDGWSYFPVFPYTSFTGMTDTDLRDLWAYLRAQPAVRRPNQPHDVWPPFGWRIGLPGWKWQFFRPGRFRPDPAASAERNRGAYLAQAVAHCGECHTPRNLAGGLKAALRFAGSADGPEGELAPNITPDEETGIGKWSRADLVWLLETGFKPDGDDTQGLMSEAIEHGYAHLTPADREAIADYVQALPPIHNKVVAPKKEKKE